MEERDLIEDRKFEKYDYWGVDEKKIWIFLLNIENWVIWLKRKWFIWANICVTRIMQRLHYPLEECHGSVHNSNKNSSSSSSSWANSCCCCSVAKSCPTLYDPMDCTTPGFPVLHHLLELAQTCVHWVHVAIQPSGPLYKYLYVCMYICMCVNISDSYVSGIVLDSREAARQSP